MSDDAEDSRGGSREWSKLLLWVLLPTIITAAAGLAPTLISWLTAPRSILQFDIISGPAIDTGAGAKRIHAIKISNYGTTALTNVEVTISVSGGGIEDLVFEKSSLHTSKTTQGPTYLISISRMLPEDVLNASVLVTATDANEPLVVAARSDQVLGSAAKQKVSATDVLSSSILLSAAATASTVFVMSVIVIYRIRRSGVFGGLNDNMRSDLITLIIGLSRVLPVPAELLFDENDELSYRRLADVLLIYGLKSSAADRDRCILCLTALLQLPSALESKRATASSILHLGGPSYSEEQLIGFHKEANKRSAAEHRRNLVNLLTS